MSNYSINQPTPAAIAATLSLLQTVPANNTRKSISIQNQSAGDIVVVGDSRIEGASPWTYILTGVGAGQQGAEIPQPLTAYRGAIQIYGAAGARVSITEV